MTDRPADQAARTPESAEQGVDVLIVGGGLVGGALAVALGGAGLTVAVVDQADPAALTASAYDGRASAIAYGSSRVLDTVGA